MGSGHVEGTEAEDPRVAVARTIRAGGRGRKPSSSDQRRTPSVSVCITTPVVSAAAFSRCSRSASARAEGRTETLAFFRSDLDKLMYTDPVIGCKIYKAIAMNIGIRLRTTDERLRNGDNGSGPSE